MCINNKWNMYGTWENSINMRKKENMLFDNANEINMKSKKIQHVNEIRTENISTTKQSARIYIRTCARTKQYWPFSQALEFCNMYKHTPIYLS